MLHDVSQVFSQLMVWQDVHIFKGRGLMDMRHHPHTATSKQVRPNAGASRWLILAVALCGALAGGSIVEAIAAMASRAPTPVSPDHLIAEPLAIAGALCGGLLAAILASKDQRKANGSSHFATRSLASITPIEIVPCEPMMWQPTPQTLPVANPAALNTPQLTRTTHHTQHIRQAIRHHRHRSHAVRISLSRPHAID